MKNPTFYETVISNVFWKEWVKDNEKDPKFDVHESIECGWLSERHFNAFLKFVARKLNKKTKLSTLIKEK